MDLTAPGVVGRDQVARGFIHTLRLVISDEATTVVDRANPQSIVLTQDPIAKEPVIHFQTRASQTKISVPRNPELQRILDANSEIKLHVRLTSSHHLILTGQVLRPEPTQIILKTESARAVNNYRSSLLKLTSENDLPPVLRAISQVTRVQVSQALAPKTIVAGAMPTIESNFASQEHARLTLGLVKSVVRSIRAIGEGSQC